jgi:hypothetical protein
LRHDTEDLFRLMLSLKRNIHLFWEIASPAQKLAWCCVVAAKNYGLYPAAWNSFSEADR